MRTRSRYRRAVSSASRRGSLRTQIGARVRFSSTVRCGNRLNCWNTMPTSRRIVSIFLTSAVNSTPATMIWPCWCSSKRLMQRIIVDLPEPEGPQTTTRSPFLTSRLMSLRTWNSPYHLSTWRSSMMGSPAGVSIAVSVMPSRQLLALPSLVELALEHLAIARHEEAEAEIDRRDKDVGLDGIAAPIGVVQCGIGGTEEIEQANDQDERGVLEGADKIVDQGW